MKRQTILSTLFIFVFMSIIHAQSPDFLFMIEQAGKAPSGHNTQPWLFKINEPVIEIHPNFEKSLPVVDFDNRELFISLGCAAENLCIAAIHKGYKPTVSVGQQGVITIHLTKQDTPANIETLIEQIALRQTNRSIYNGKMIAEDTIRLLKSIDTHAEVNIYFYEKGSPEFDTIAQYVFRGNLLQMQDKAFKNELRSWMRYNKKHQDETNDGLSYAVFGAPNLPKFIVKPIMSKAINGKSQNKSDKKKIESSSHFVLFTIQNNNIAEWINLGRTLERFLLKSTGSGIAHAYLNQPNEIRFLSKEMAKAIDIQNGYTAILLRIRYGKKMPYSKRKDIRQLIIKD